MQREYIIPYPNQDMTDLDMAWLTDIASGAVHATVKQDIANNTPPWERYVHQEEYAVNKILKNDKQDTDFQEGRFFANALASQINFRDFLGNCFYDTAKIKEIQMHPIYQSDVDGEDVIYNAKNFYNNISWIAFDNNLFFRDNVVCYGSIYKSDTYNGMLLLWRNKYKENEQGQQVLNDEPFFYTLYSLQNGGGAIFLGLGFRSPSATLYNTCDDFIFRVLPSRQIEVFTIEGGLKTFTIESFVSVSAYAKHIFASLSDGSVGIYTQDCVLKGKVNNTEGLPYFYWNKKYFFKYYNNGKVGTLIFNTDFKPLPSDVLKYLPSNIKPPSETIVKENSTWHTKSVLGLYDFYGLGTYKNTRYKYALRKYGNFTPDTRFKTPVKAFDQYGDFHSVLSGDKIDQVCHTYDNKRFTFYGVKFTLPTKANRFLFGKNGGFLGKVFLERTNDTYRIKTELFRLTKEKN